jgi:methylenetetrahydrofolate dehydrogenase (NADP+)/methenyltetrahydrofolate cyclohydrolase
MVQILNGKVVAEKIKSEICIISPSDSPGLAVILASEDAASEIYIRKKQEACAAVGIRSFVVRPFGDNISLWDINHLDGHLLATIDWLNNDGAVDGILLQLPVHPNIILPKILDAINPSKDVDVLTPVNLGLLLQGRGYYKPCTPAAVEEILSYYNIPTVGKKMVVINRSNIVGKPLFSMMIQDNKLANATVTLCHDQTPKDTLKEICLSADIIVVAVGIPKFLTKDMVRKGQTVIDVGINRTPAGIVGDVDFQEVSTIVENITPVPNGVGPVTVAMLLQNTYLAHRKHRMGEQF